MNELNTILKETNPLAWKQFEFCTKEFEEVEDLSEVDEFGFPNQISMQTDELPLDYMVFLTLVNIKEFKYLYRPMEKVAWVIPFKFKGHYFSFSKQKLGFRLKTIELNEEITKQMLMKLYNAFKIIDRLVNPIINSLIQDGRITLQNRFTILRERYLYFREKAKSSYEEDKSIMMIDESSIDTIKIVTDMFNSQMKKEKEGFFNTQAMLDAYFSFLEHILVLLLPFSHFNREKDKIDEFIGKDWTSKYNHIFRPNKNKIMMKHYDNLQNIKERFRNTFAHGGFEKQNGSLFVHFDGLGAIPIQLSQFRNSVNFSFLPVYGPDFHEITKAIDDFESYLTEPGKWGRAMEILSSGHDIHFDEEYIEAYKAVIESDDLLNEFLEYEGYMFDKHSNMEW